MISYFWLIVITILGTLILCVALLFAKDAKRVFEGDEVDTEVIIFLFCFLVSCACLYPVAFFIINSPATVEDISYLTRTCLSAKEAIQSKTQLVRHREVIALYNQCLRELELAEEVTLEKQKRAAEMETSIGNILPLGVLPEAAYKKAAVKK